MTATEILEAVKELVPDQRKYLFGKLDDHYCWECGRETVDGRCKPCIDEDDEDDVDWDYEDDEDDDDSEYEYDESDDEDDDGTPIYDEDDDVIG